MPTPFPRRTDHPYLAASLMDMPADLRLLAEQALKPDEAIDTIFIIPAQTLLRKIEGRGGMHRVPDQALLFTPHRVIHIMGGNSPGRPGQVIHLRGDQLLYTHLSLVLLYGRLEFCGIEGEALTHIVVEYNTVGHDFLHPTILRFLRLAWQQPQSQRLQHDQTDTLLQELFEKSFKFRNGLKIYAMQPGEPLLGFVFQPRIMRPYFRIFHRLVAPATLLALTQNDLVLIQEGRSSVSSYGWFITFCPRICVSGIEITPNVEWQDVNIHLKRGDFTADHQVTVENTAARNWQSLWMRLNQGRHL